MEDKLINEDNTSSDYVKEEIALRNHFLKSKGQPDVEAELDAFHRGKKTAKNRSLAIFGSAAAAVLLLAFVYVQWFKESNSAVSDQLVYKIRTDSDEVTLQSGSSDAIAISSGGIKKLTAPPISIDGGVSYAKIDHQPPLSEETIVVPNGRVFKVVLQDGSEVWLNAHSKLKFPNRFANGERRVVLEGEGFFEVKEDKSRPFIVETNSVTTKVLGTAFNVKANEAGSAQVLLVHGKVEVEGQKQTKVLAPGDFLQTHNRSSFVLTKIDLDTYYSWHDGYFYFDNESLFSVLQELGRWYNMDVIIENDKTANAKIRFTADRAESKANIINMLNDLKIAKLELKSNAIVVH